MSAKNNLEAAAFNKLTAVYRLLICLLIAIIYYFLIPLPEKITVYTHILSAWDIFSLCMIILSWVTFFTISHHQMRGLTQLQDESRTIIFIIILVSTFTILLAVLLLLTSKVGDKITNDLPLIIAIAGMTFSWLLVHT